MLTLSADYYSQSMNLYSASFTRGVSHTTRHAWVSRSTTAPIRRSIASAVTTNTNPTADTPIASSHATPSTPTSPLNVPATYPSRVKPPSTPLRIHPTAAEKAAGRLSWRNLEIATRALRRDGLVVVAGLIDHEPLDRLNAYMVPDALSLQARGEKGPYNYNRSNVQQDPLLTLEKWEPDVFVSKCSYTPKGGHPPSIPSILHFRLLLLSPITLSH